MASIIAGTFNTLIQAEAAVRALLQEDCERNNISTFFSGPPGQHGTFPVGGDEDADPQAEGAQTSALKGVGIGVGVGGLLGSAGGPLGIVAGAAVGAYIGSLAGALGGVGQNVEEKPDDPAALRRPGGVMVAVNIEGQASEQHVANILRDNGASAVERANGEWHDGEWADFDPVSPPRLVEDAQLLA